MARISQKELKKDEFVEAAADVSHWLERNWGLVAKITGTVIVAVLIGAGWSAWSRQTREKTQGMLADAVTIYQKVGIGNATDPVALDGALSAFDDVIARAGDATPAHVARYYQGVLLLRSGQATEAVEQFQAVVARPENPLSLGGAARGMLADALVAAGRDDEAIELLAQMSTESDPAIPAEQILFKLGWIHAEAGNDAEARTVWQELLDKYPSSPPAQEITRILGPEATES